MRQRLLFALVVLLLLALGLLGQHQIAAERLTQHFTTSLYQVMMLFLLAG